MELGGEDVVAPAVVAGFGNDEELCKIVLFGLRLTAVGTDTVSSKAYVPIGKPRKDTTNFYGRETAGDNKLSNSYVYDKYMTHVELVTPANCV